MLLEEARLGYTPDRNEAAWFKRNGCQEADVSKFLADLERIAAKALPSAVGDDDARGTQWLPSAVGDDDARGT